VFLESVNITAINATGRQQIPIINNSIRERIYYLQNSYEGRLLRRETLDCQRPHARYNEFTHSGLSTCSIGRETDKLHLFLLIIKDQWVGINVLVYQ